MTENIEGIASALEKFNEVLAQFQIGSLPTKAKRKGRIPPPLNSEEGEFEKNKALDTVLRQLAAIETEDALDITEIQEYVSFFAALYGGEEKYRHLYSKVCDVMYSFFDDNDGTPGYLDDTGIPLKIVNLATNIDIICDATKEANINQSVVDGTRKLHDHIELEITRMRYTEKRRREQHETTQKLNETFDSLDERFESSKKSFEAAQDKIQRNYVTILGIFAAIVLAFTGGMTLSASVFDSIDSASIYRLMIVFSLVALFVFDLIVALCCFILRVTGITLNPEQSGIKSPFYWAVGIINTVFILVAIGSVVLRYCC